MMKNWVLQILNSKYVFWFLLSLPAWPLVTDIGAGDRYYAEIMYESGIYSIQLIVFALALTPLQMLLGQVPIAGKVLRWFLKRRRAIGVTGFAFGGLHTFFYVRFTGSFDEILLEAIEPELLTGWLAFIVLLVLALTSNQYSIRLLNRNWKRLQRGAYLAAVLVALHWLWIDQFLGDLWFLFVPLVLLQIVRFFITRHNAHRSKSASTN